MQGNLTGPIEWIIDYALCVKNENYSFYIPRNQRQISVHVTINKSSRRKSDIFSDSFHPDEAGLRPEFQSTLKILT